MISGYHGGNVTEDELAAIFKRAGLDVPTTEQHEIARIMPFIDEMKASIRKTRLLNAEPAFIFLMKKPNL